MDLNPETVRFLIDKAREFQVNEEIAVPDEPLNASDDWALQIIADHGDDPTYREVKATIDDLEPDQQVSLVALMWIGRGDYGSEEWDEAYRSAGENWNARTAEYLLGTPLLADYLLEGLDALGYD